MMVSNPTVLVVYVCARGNCWQQLVPIDAGMTVEQAVAASDFQNQYPDVDWQAGGVGIFGKRVMPDDAVSAGERIEIYRALVFDPKESRRRRALHRQRQRLKQTGDRRRGR